MKNLLCPGCLCRTYGHSDNRTFGIENRIESSPQFRGIVSRASVLPFQKCVNSVSGFANSVFYRFRFGKFRFLPFQIFKIPFNFFQAVFLLSIIFVFNKVSVSAF